MAYPDWVLKHKSKGTYINCVGGKYYLYAAHSERIPGTKKVKRISDGYLGRITEQDGLIPSKDKVSSDILIYEYGLSCMILQLCENIYKGFKKTSPKNADHIMVSCILLLSFSICSSSSIRRSLVAINRAQGVVLGQTASGVIFVHTRILYTLSASTYPPSL